MRIVIAGCGRVGSELANTLSIEGHEISIIDRDTESFKRLSKGFKGLTIQGVCFDLYVLKAAGIERADAFAAVTASENSNLVSVVVAREVFRVPKVVARIYDPRGAEIYRKEGIPTISDTIWGANTLKSILCRPGNSKITSLGSGEVEILQIEIPSKLIKRTVANLTMPAQSLVVGIVRDGRAFIPTMGSQFQENDIIIVSVVSSAISKFMEMVYL